MHFAEIAHIIAANQSGPRGDRTKSPQSLARYDNLILLCANTHTVVDKAPEVFPVDLLQCWKREHSEKIDQVFDVGPAESRSQARTKFAALAIQNQTVFEQYGPQTDHRFNPESPIPSLWRKHVRTTILPNNRTILRLLDANVELLTPGERSILELFRIHVRDLEARHLEERVTVGGARYPAGMDNLLLDGERDA